MKDFIFFKHPNYFFPPSKHGFLFDPSVGSSLTFCCKEASAIILFPEEKKMSSLLSR